jgi:hypothetical protein
MNAIATTSKTINLGNGLQVTIGAHLNGAGGLQGSGLDDADAFPA